MFSRTPVIYYQNKKKGILTFFIFGVEMFKRNKLEL